MFTKRHHFSLLELRVLKAVRICLKTRQMMTTHVIKKHPTKKTKKICLFFKCFGNCYNKMEWMYHTIHTSHVDHWHANKAPDPNNSLDVGNVFRRFSFFACLAVQVLLMVFSICCSIVALGGHCCFLCSSEAATSAHLAGHHLLLAS